MTYFLRVLCVVVAVILFVKADDSKSTDDNIRVTDEAWFEVEVSEPSGEVYRGKFTVALFGEVVPMTVMNFLALTKGYKRAGETLSYKGTRVHRIVPDFVVQMGDVTNQDGTGGKSIYGERFNDENFVLSHRGRGWVSMANHGTDTNGSQFFILLNRARWLDGKHVVFGKVIKGMDVIQHLGEVKSDPDTAVPYNWVKIVDCGINLLDKKYPLSPAELNSEEDLQ